MEKPQLTPEQREAMNRLADSMRALTKEILNIHEKSTTTAESMAKMRRAFGMDQETN